ncbi:hypothetical protein [Deinococcus knuensis]|uniref:hypothetical protein n=1 Tax=Deinococcus knuensis TaxID=1837380 RepID=UPI00166767AB|nr:hypothetical protein [Deinococcus knuensis]
MTLPPVAPATRHTPPPPTPHPESELRLLGRAALRGTSTHSERDWHPIQSESV